MTLEEYRLFLEALAEKNRREKVAQTGGKNTFANKQLKKKRFTKTKNTNHAKRRF
ncbi:MAG: hypothetical protein H6550_13635 [Chitinophagales bacterium]|nr:hypothetical protein [Chitinophagales bacterium]